MTRRERLKRCYFHQEVDRPAVFCRGAVGKKNDPSYAEMEAYVRQHSELKDSFSLHGLTKPYPTTNKEEPLNDDFSRIITTLHTPKGPLQSTRLHSLKNQPGLHESFLLKDREDAERYLSLPMPEIGGDFSPFFEKVKQMGDDGIVEVSTPSMNPGGHVAELFGSETFAMMTLTDRDILHALCERQMKIILSAFKYAIDQGAGPFFAMLGEEYILPPLHGPADFQDFNVRYDKPILDLVHNAGGRMHIHSHGPIRKTIGMFVDMGVDVLHPFEAPPMGDITAAQAKEAARGRMTLEGNIQIADMYEKSADCVRDQAKALIRDCFDDHRGLIVCATASPYIYGEGKTCWPQYKAMIDAVIGA